MFNKVKHLLKRGSSISKSQTMYDIYKVVKQMISGYSNHLIDDAYKKEKSKPKGVNFFIQSVCVYINTIDHVKDTLGNVSDLIVTLLEPPYTEQVEFTQEEDNCLELINELIVMIKKVAEVSLDNAFNSSFSKINWEKFDENSLESSKYVQEARDGMRAIADVVRGKIGVVHFTKILNMICQAVNGRFVNSVLKLKKISDAGLSQLQRDFNELRAELESLGTSPTGEPISKIYSKFV